MWTGGTGARRSWRTGKASVTLSAFTSPGSRHVSIEYTGVPGTTNDSADTLTLRVVKATPSVKVAVSPKTVHRKRTHARLAITLAAPGQTVSGYVAVRSQGRAVDVVRLSGGSATVTLPAYPTTGRKAVTVKYLGSDLANEVSKRLTIRVVR